MTWAWPIIIYLWLAGIAGGAYFATFLAYHLSGGKYHGARRVAAALGVPGVVLGVILLVIDLGHPLRAWHLFAGFRLISPMSVGSWLLLLWAALGILLFVIWWAESLVRKGATAGWKGAIGRLAVLGRLVGVLDWIEFLLSILLATYTGVLLSATGNALWSTTVLLPALFVASAVSTGIAIVNLAGALGVRQVGTQLSSRLCHGSATICMIEILLLGGLLLWVAGTPSAASAYAVQGSPPAGAAWTLSAATVHSVSNLISGALSVPFWVGVVLVGLVLPLGTEMSLVLRQIEEPPRALLAVATLMVLSGGFLLRAVIVFGGQM
jgi:formate-dependent nitrite reductase membrane component NrfD